MRILIDTNIILDLVQNREPHCENASSIINSCVKGEHMGYISSHSLSDLFYILRKIKVSMKEKQLFYIYANFSQLFLKQKICLYQYVIIRNGTI